MKENKVLSAIYGIVLFVALIGVVALLYNAIEMLNYTTSYIYDSNYYAGKEFTDVQKPIAIALLVASIVGILGVAAGVVYLFVQKPLLKIIILSCIAIVIAVIFIAIITVCAKWNSYYSNVEVKLEGSNKVHLIGGTGFNSQDTKMAGTFAIYSASLTSLIQNLVCFVVIAAALVYDFVKGILNKKKGNKTEEVVDGEITE